MSPPSDQQGQVPLPDAVAALRGWIHDGDYRPGSRFPSQAELKHNLPAATRTVAQAIAVLKDAGYLRTFRGVGTYVRGRNDWRDQDYIARVDGADQADAGWWLLVWAADLAPGDRIRLDGAEYRIVKRNYPPPALTTFNVLLSGRGTEPLKKMRQVWVWDPDGAVAARVGSVIDRRRT